MRNTTTARALGAAILAGLTLAAAGCSDDDASGSSARTRPEVVFAAGGDVLEIPPQVPSGFVDIRVEALESGPAHLLIGQLVDGMSFEEYESLSEDESAEEPFTIKGGNGTIAPGDEALLTLNFTPGNYIVINIFQDSAGELKFADDGRFTVSESDNTAAAPVEEGTITLGPGMLIAAPEDFDATGVWRFENRDPLEPHEAAMVRLADGKSVQDLIAWFADQQGPPPMDGEFGSMGAIGPGGEAWITFGDLAPGTYAMVCFIPGEDGIPHLAKGMATEVSVS